MNSKRQHLLIECLLSNSDIYSLSRSIIKPEYFNPEYRKHVQFIHSYYEDYRALPSAEIVSSLTDVQFTTKTITRDEIEFYTDQIEQFCRTKAIAHAVLKAGPIIQKEDESQYGNIEKEIKEAVSVSLNKDMGISYFDNIMERLEQTAVEEPRISTGWKNVDDLLDGGLARTEMILFTANSGGGKSITLANLGINLAQQKLNVLYVSLELSEKMITKRYDLMFTGIPTAIHREKYKTIAEQLFKMKDQFGNIVVKYMNSGSNCNHIRSYLKEYEMKFGYAPDLLILDYLDLLSPIENVAAANVFEKDKLSAEQLRNIGADYNMIIATASQQNRAALEAPELHQGHIAGGLSKINTVDVTISLILTPAMKAAGDIGMSFLKTRSSDGVGKIVYNQWHNNTLRITDKKGTVSTPIVNHLKAQGPKSVLDIMDF